MGRLAVITIVAVLVAVGAAQSLASMVGGGRSSAQPAATSAPATEAASAVVPRPSAAVQDGEADLTKSADGHFWADADVGGHPVHFLVDTGATAVALTAEDARALGIEPSSLTYSYSIMTANGQARAAAVKLPSISVGGARVDNVDAFVIDQGLQTSLLGMTYLGRLSKFEATQTGMVLHG
ncbi:MAG: TIGR02281 family clan AA aspartic protease [Caulobacterales bacterium]